MNVIIWYNLKDFRSFGGLSGLLTLSSMNIMIIAVSQKNDKLNLV